MHSREHETSTRHEGILLQIRELLSPHQFKTWFREVKVEDLADGGLRLLVPNLFVRDWISNYYVDILAHAVRRCYGVERTLAIAVDPDAPSAALVAAVPESRPAATAEDPASAPPPPELDTAASDMVLTNAYTFSNFVVGSSNRFAHATAVAVAEAPGKSYNPLFLHGSVGLGKTHLLQAVCHQILVRQPSARILYLSCESFINQFISSLENNALSSFRHKYRNVDVLLVDDIQLLANKERTQEEFFHTFNTLHHLGRQIVLSSDAPPKDIPTLQERLVSRFKMGMVVEVDPPDFETRVNILKNKARLRSNTLADEVAQFLAEHVSTNIRELEGAVIRLIAYAALVNRPIDLALAREAMADGTPRRNAAVTIHDIVTVVTRYYNVKLSDLQSRRRTQSIAFPRQVCMHLARNNTNLSLEEIGAYFGGRDHTTVLYALEKIARLMEEDRAQGDVIRRLEREIGGTH